MLKRFVPDGRGIAPVLVEFYSPPLGITDFTQDLEGKLGNHIQLISEGERNEGEVLYDNTSRLIWEVHEAVRLYQHANQSVRFSSRPVH